MILEVSKSDLCYVDIKVALQQGTSQQKCEGYQLREDGILMYRHRVYVPNDQELKNLLLSEMHKVPYVGHPSYQKTIATVKKQYYWSLILLLDVLNVRRSSPSTNIQLDYYSLFQFVSGSGKL
jgi:hypothetical protein